MLSIVPGRDKPMLDGGDLPWITVSDIDSLNVFESIEGLSLSKKSLKKAHGRTAPKRAVIMSCVGSFGLVAITGKELVINQQLHAFCGRRQSNARVACIQFRTTRKIHG